MSWLIGSIWGKKENRWVFLQTEIPRAKPWRSWTFCPCVTLCESGWCNRPGVNRVKFSTTLVQASERLGHFSVCKSEQTGQEIIMNFSAWLRKHLLDRNVSEGGHTESTPPFTPSLLSVRCSRLALRELCFSYTLYCAEGKKTLNDAFQALKQTARPKIVHMHQNTHLLNGWDSGKHYFSFSSCFFSPPIKPQCIHMCMSVSVWIKSALLPKLLEQ